VNFKKSSRELAF